MAFTKHASFDVIDILDIKGSSTQRREASFDRISNFDAYRTTDGYMYVRLRAISSRTNKNHDGWPTIELAGSPDILARHQSSEGFTIEAAQGNKDFGFSTFVGKPIFVDHNNGDPKKTRGVIVDSKFRVLSPKEAKLDSYWSSSDVDPEHLPASEIELLLEVDAQAFPKLAADILNGDLDGFSMGADVERSKCSHCGHIASNPEEYCSHVLMKGAHHDFKTADGKRVSRKSYENCYGIKFFEISAVFEPADETALARDVTAKQAAVMQVPCPHCGSTAEYSTNNGSGACRTCGTMFTGQQIQHGQQGNDGAWTNMHNQGDMGQIHPVGGGFPESMEGPSINYGDGSIVAPDFTHLPGQLPSNLGPMHQGNVKTAEADLPQSMKTHAPDEIDTLRDERVCPICFAPGTMIRTIDGYQAIETITPGTKVLTHNGSFQEVLKASATPYQGDLLAIESGLTVQPILTTPNHPFRTLLAETEHDCRPGSCDKALSFDQTHRLGWACAGHLNDRAYLVANVPKVHQDIDSIAISTRGKKGRKEISTLELTNEMLWMMGLYIAEGSDHHREITFSLHAKETDYERRLRNIFTELGLTITTKRKSDKPNSMWVHVYSTTLVEVFREWFGHGCQNKMIPNFLLNLPTERLAYVIQGIADGDGCDQTDTVKQTSPTLALQLMEFGHRDRNHTWPTTTTEYHDDKRTAYAVHNTMGTRARHVRDPQRVIRFGQGKWSFDDQPLHRIRTLSTIPYNGTVYNLEVANDHTYTVGQVLVHNCGNDMEGETCDVCGYVEPPKGFDNPDLSQAEKIRGEMKQQEMKQQEDAAAQPQAQPAPPQPGQQPPPGAPPSKAPATARVTNEMSWKPLVTPKTAARINKVEQPVHAPTAAATNEPTTQTVTSDQTRPVTAAMLTAQRLMATAQRNHTGESMSTRIADATSPGDTAPTTRVDVTGVGGVDQASNEAASKANAQVDVGAVGGTGVEGVDAQKTESLPTASEKSDDSGFNTDKTTDDSGPTSTYGDSDGSHSGVSDPVTSEAFPASEDGVKAAKLYKQYRKAQAELRRLGYDEKSLEQNEQQGNEPASGGSATKGVQPVAESFGDRVDVLQSTTSPSNNSGPTKTWSGTDGNGVLKQQDPVDGHSQEWGGVKVPDVQLHTTGKAHFLAAIRLAEAEVELGITERDAKFNRIAELDAQTPAEVNAQLEALARVKTAGLAKLAQTRQAGVRRLPTAFGKATAAPNGFERIASDAPAQAEPVSDDLLDAALFTR